MKQSGTILDSLDRERHKHVLERKFSRSIRRRGKVLFEKGHVQNVRELDQVVFAFVRSSADLDDYFVDFKYEDDLLLEVACNCSYHGFCKHEAALLYYLIDRAGEKATLRNRGSLKEKIQPRKSDGYQPLPVLQDFSMQEVLEELKPNVPFWMAQQKITHWFESKEELLSELSERSWGHTTKVVAEVSIKRQSKVILVKCNDCYIRSKKLCIHEHRSLIDLLAHDSGTDWLQGRLDVDEFYASVAEERKISPENLAAAMHIGMQGDRGAVKPRVEGLVLDMQADDLRQMVRVEVGLEQKPTEQILSDLEKYALYENALVWQPWPLLADQVIFRVIEGRTDRQRTKLTAYVSEVEYPTHFTGDQRWLFQQLIAALATGADELTVHQALSKVMLSNLETVEGVMHYYLDQKSALYHRNEKLKKKDIHQISFASDRARVRFRAYLEYELIVFLTTLIIGDKEVGFEQLSFNNGQFICDADSNAYLFTSAKDARAVQFFKNKSKLLFYPNERARFIPFLEEICRQYEVEIDLPFVNQEKVDKAERRIYLKEVESYVVFEPVLAYGDLEVNAFGAKEIQGEDGRLSIYQVDEKLRNDFEQDLDRIHPNWAERRQGTAYHLKGEELMKDLWFLDFVNRCKDVDIEIFGKEKLKHFKYNTNRAQVSSGVKSGIDWFDVDVAISFGDQVVKTKDWLEAIKNNTPYVKLGDGSIGILPEKWLARLRQIQKTAIFDKQGLHIDKLKFNLVDQLFDEVDMEDKAQAEIAEKKHRLSTFTTTKGYNLPRSIKAELRDYQLAGYKWLRFLKEFGFGGCLADDMGLGKTLQAICVLADHHSTKKVGTSLVVAPRTLLFNWASEIDKFCPTLTYIVHHGPIRAKCIDDLEAFDIVISTYDTVASDIEFLKDKTWSYVILDESQAIKNPQSKRFKAMRLLQATYRLVMTGTPIENSTFDLFAQMTFANPGLLGNMTTFKRDYVLPIEKYHDEDSGRHLQQLIHPFVLRRTKEQVAKDLPEKTESVLYCEMGQSQRKQYDQLKHQIRKSILDKVDESGIAKSKFMILDGLLRLRQMCNSPLLVDPGLKGTNRDSVKIDKLVEQITNEIGTHNALVFSQFTSMLALISARLDKLKIPYVYLDGSTRDRQGAVNTFQTSDTFRIFLISLKAGNTGLNLIKADYVFIVDPWWNPAVEAQAIDRTHRIGQDKHIFAYKLICKDSIEEKILELQQKKKKLASDIIHSDATIMKSLTKKDLLNLFE